MASPTRHDAVPTAPARTDTPAADLSAESAVRPRLVLLVVPDGPLCRFLQRLCERRGHTVLIARSADDGLRLLSQLPDRPDVALLDGTLTADTVAGRASVERFVSLAPTVPLVVIGGRVRDVDIPRLTLHPSRWVPAPFDGETLLAALEAVADATPLVPVSRFSRLA